MISRSDSVVILTFKIQETSNAPDVTPTAQDSTESRPIQSESTSPVKAKKTPTIAEKNTLYHDEMNVEGTNVLVDKTNLLPPPTTVPTQKRVAKRKRSLPTTITTPLATFSHTSQEDADLEELKRFIENKENTSE